MTSAQSEPGQYKVELAEAVIKIWEEFARLADHSTPMRIRGSMLCRELSNLARDGIPDRAHLLSEDDQRAEWSYFVEYRNETPGVTHALHRARLIVEQQANRIILRDILFFSASKNLSNGGGRSGFIKIGNKYRSLEGFVLSDWSREDAPVIHSPLKPSLTNYKMRITLRSREGHYRRTGRSPHGSSHLVLR